MNVNEFKAELVNGGARSNTYRVTCPFPVFAGGNKETRRLTFLCKGAQLPGSNIGVTEAFFQGRPVPLPGDRTYPEWTITVFSDGEFAVRDAFEKWSNGCANHTQNTGLPVEEVLTDITVEQLDRNGDSIKTYTLRGCWPSEVAPVDIAYDQNDAIQEFTVTLQMFYWESNTTS